MWYVFCNDVNIAAALLYRPNKVAYNDEFWGAAGVLGIEIP